MFTEIRTYVIRTYGRTVPWRTEENKEDNTRMRKYKNLKLKLTYYNSIVSTYNLMVINKE